MKDNLSKKIKANEGITLIALVITIIILLILAGVTLGLVFNSDGLFIKANEATSRYNQSKKEESEFLQGAEKDLNKYNGVYGGSDTDIPNPSETVTPTPNPTPVLPEVGTQVPEAGWTVEEAKGIVERDGLKAHLGEKVQYSPTEDPTGVYRIFYYDNEVNIEDPTKGYFGDKLNTLYLKRDYVSSDTKLNSYTNYNPIDDGETMKKMNPLWAKASNGDAIDLVNEHCVAWLCDPNKWENYKVEGVANYVVGSPSVEMYMKAFGVYKEEDGDSDRNSTALVCKIDDASRKIGYLVGTNNKYSYTTAKDTIETGPNNIFMTGAYNWWLASPSSENQAELICVQGSNASLSWSYYDSMSGVCPIVSIN